MKKDNGLIGCAIWIGITIIVAIILYFVFDKTIGEALADAATITFGIAIISAPFFRMYEIFKEKGLTGLLADIIYISCILIQIILAYQIIEYLLKHQEIGWLIICFVFCEIILNNFKDPSLSQMVIEFIKKKDKE